MAEAGLINYGRKTSKLIETSLQSTTVPTNLSLPQASGSPLNLNPNNPLAPRRNKKMLKIGTWNVRTLLDQPNSNRPERRTALVARELMRYDIDIAALSETRFADQGKLREAGPGYTFFWSGLPKDARREAGVGFAVSDRILQRLIEEPNCVNARLMTVRIRLSRRQSATLVSTYAPTMTYTDEEKNKYYTDLSRVLQKIPQHDRLFLLGDFNARVGRDDNIWRKILGPFGIGTMNDNGQRLLSLCASFELAITNTWFNPGRSSQATWTHPRSGHGHLIDYVIVRQRDLREIQVTSVMRGAECSTDHFMVRTKVRIRLAKFHKTKHEKRIWKLNTGRLSNPEVAEQFQKALTSKISHPTTFVSGEEQWRILKTGLEQTAIDVLGPLYEKQRDWFDENNGAISSLLTQKNIAYKKSIQNPACSTAQENFRDVKNEFTERLRQLKNEWWMKMSREVQFYADNRQQRNFFESLKRIYGPKTRCIQMLEDTLTNEKLTKTSDITAAWKSHFSTLLNRPTDVNWTRVDGLHQYEIKTQMDNPPTMTELQTAITQLRNNKTPGEDGLPSELYKYGGTFLREQLLNLLCTIWEAEDVPQDFKNATIVPLFKGKGSRLNVNNYRGISLLSVAGKILSRILLNRLNAEILNVHTPEEQCGFRSGRSTIDLIFAVRQLQEKCREQNQSLYALFVDFTKAFDSVNRAALWTVLGKFGCPRKFVNIIKSLHAGMRAQVRTCGTTSSDFEVDTGVKQGCVLAPTLFSLYLTVVCMEAFRGSEDGIPIQYRSDGHTFTPKRFSARTLVQDSKIRMLLFADDCALLAHSEAELQRLTTDFASAASDFGLEINLSKTLAFYQPVISGDGQIPNITVQDSTMAYCSDFCYLGSTVSTDLSVDKDLQSRIAKASVAFGRLRKRVFNNHDLRVDTKVAVYRAVVLSTLLYGSETWTLYRRHIRQLDRFHQYCLRQILRIHWSDRVTNTQVLRNSGVSGMEAMLIRNQLRWAGHVERMADSRLPKQLLYGQLKNGSRKRGRPKLRFTDTLQVSLKVTNIPLRSWNTLARDRGGWRRAIYVGVSNFEARRVSLLEHKRAVRKRPTPPPDTRIDSFNCPICRKRCRSRIGLLAHQRTHTKRQRVS